MVSEIFKKLLTFEQLMKTKGTQFYILLRQIVF